MWEPHKTHLSSMILHDASIIQSKPVNSHDSAATPPQSHDSSNKPHFSSAHIIRYLHVQVCVMMHPFHPTTYIAT